MGGGGGCGSPVADKEVVVSFQFHLVSEAALNQQPVLAKANNFVQADEVPISHAKKSFLFLKMRVLTVMPQGS